jgi:hypothetical protein
MRRTEFLPTYGFTEGFCGKDKAERGSGGEGVRKTTTHSCNDLAVFDALLA